MRSYPSSGHRATRHQLATTVCFHSVLQEMLAYAGRALERLVQGVQSQEAIVPDISLALFLQLCSRQEGIPCGRTPNRGHPMLPD